MIFQWQKILDDAGIDILLVGDSASNVMAGHETTLPITLDQMIYHAQSVVRAVKRCFVVVDLPFGSYQGNSREALNASIRIMKETGGHGVKLEGGQRSRRIYHTYIDCRNSGDGPFRFNTTIYL
jgi:3-methyl-2-oxobutanoate hydroxymethyltransferase